MSNDDDFSLWFDSNTLPMRNVQTSQAEQETSWILQAYDSRRYDEVSDL